MVINNKLEDSIYLNGEESRKKSLDLTDQDKDLSNINKIKNY